MKSISYFLESGSSPNNINVIQQTVTLQDTRCLEQCTDHYYMIIEVLKKISAAVG